MKLGPRGKLLLVALLFALPMVASTLAYVLLPPAPSGNYGELLLPPARTPGHELRTPTGEATSLARMEGKWLVIASGGGACTAECAAKAETLRWLKLALGRNSGRVRVVFVVDDLAPPDPQLVRTLEGIDLLLTPRGLQAPPGAGNDRAHIHLADPRGNVMLRWPAQPDRKRMLKDLERLLKASQIG